MAHDVLRHDSFRLTLDQTFGHATAEMDPQGHSQRSFSRRQVSRTMSGCTIRTLPSRFPRLCPAPVGGKGRTRQHSWRDGAGRPDLSPSRCAWWKCQAESFPSMLTACCCRATTLRLPKRHLPAAGRRDDRAGRVGWHAVGGFARRGRGGNRRGDGRLLGGIATRSHLGRGDRHARDPFELVPRMASSRAKDRIVWGHAPGAREANEPATEEKVAILKAFLGTPTLSGPSVRAANWTCAAPARGARR